MKVEFYTRRDCSLCHSALAVVKRLQQRLAFELEVIDIDSDPLLRARYDQVIPVVTCENNELARSFIDEQKLHQALLKKA